MLSILIPIYNYNSYNLVKAISTQAENAGVNYEIIVIDDCSNQKFVDNTHIHDLPHCTYIELAQNIGRAKIRNLLASKAKYDFLLFMDCDALVYSATFLKKYLVYCNKNSVVCGGCLYNQKVTNTAYLLRLQYGKARESRTVEERQEFKYNSFSSFNFLIPKVIFDSIRFNENIVEYGHEDTVFGYELKLHNYNILHIDNPLIHEGLEPAAVFLSKTKKSMKNLYIISQETKYQNIIVDIKVLKAYRLLKKCKLNKIYLQLFQVFSSNIERNLLGKHPRIFLFDLYKLAHLCLTYKN